MSRKHPGRGKRPAPRPSAHQEPPLASLPAHLCEADVAEGLESIAATELLKRFGTRVRLHHKPDEPPEPGVLRFTFHGDLQHLLALRTVLAVYLVRHFPVPRPRGLLGDEHFRALLDQIRIVRALAPPDSYHLLYLSAAGADSSVMVRLQDDLAEQSGLEVASHEGDLLIRVRRPPDGAEGWEVLMRLSPRPLATRPWRQCNMEGALNATVAHAMVLLTAPTQSDVCLNLACGSGTLMAERLLLGPAARMMGCDINPEALACARTNLDASGWGSRAELHPWDAQTVPLSDHSVDVLLADLPFGHLVGSHAENLVLYPAILQEAARLARPGSPFVLITHEVRLMEELLAASPHWRTERVQRVLLGGLHPRIFVLRRRKTGRR